ncbi:unnamed protein product [Cochlearia groenlandica]
MATEEEAPFSSAATASSSETARGVGGKLKRQTARRHSTTPYSRPPQNQVQRSPWISRIVDPAYRIISGGATRLLPYFFSKIASNPALTAPDEQDQHQDELQNGLQENDPCITPSLNKPESASVEEEEGTSIANFNEGKFSIPAQTNGKKSFKDVVAISELERLMEGKTFSQAETNRLIEILTSRAIDIPDAKRGEENLEIPLREGVNKSMSFFDNRKDSIGGKDANSELWATPTPLAKSIIRDEASLSPAELAKAYMGGHASSSSQGFGARNEKNGFDRGIFGAKSSVGSPLSKPSTCWPGIKSSEQYGYDTPQSQRGNFGLQNFPRTPYSRTILSNSRSKMMQLQGDSSKRLNTFQSPSQSVQTGYGQLNLTKEKDVGTFGPNRRSRHSGMMSPYSRPMRGTSRFQISATAKSSEAGESSNLYKSETTAYGKYKGLEVGTPTVPTHSSQIAKTILDNLQRTQPTPKDKSAELKLSTSWRYPQSSKSVEPNSSKDGSTKLNEDIRNIFSDNRPSSVPKFSAITTTDTQNAVMKNASASNGIFRGRHEASSSGTTLQNELEKPKGSLTRSTHDEGAAKSVPYSFGGSKPPSHPLGNSKPVLPSISISKPFQKWAAPSGSNAGFTFPVSSPDGATSSEPTTPSIMPFTTSPAPAPLGVAIKSRHEAEKDDEVPQFRFVSNREGEESLLDFTFPSVREEVKSEDDEKLTFGSEKPERIAFGLEGSDGVCC